MDDYEYISYRDYYQSSFYKYHLKYPNPSLTDPIEEEIRVLVDSKNQNIVSNIQRIIDDTLMENVDLLEKILATEYASDMFWRIIKKAINRSNMEVFDCLVNQLQNADSFVSQKQKELLPFIIIYGNLSIVEKIVSNTEINIASNNYRVINVAILRDKIFRYLVETSLSRGDEIQVIFKCLSKNDNMMHFTMRQLKFMMDCGLRVEDIESKSLYHFSKEMICFLVDNGLVLDTNQILRHIGERFDDDNCDDKIYEKIDYLFDYSYQHNIPLEQDTLKIFVNYAFNQKIVDIFIKYNVDLSFVKPSKKASDTMIGLKTCGLDEASILDIFFERSDE